VFRRGVLKLEDLQPGMALSGVVLNVVDFGVFVAIGLSDTGLIHISRLADRYVRDPHDVVGVGDVIAVWVVDVDKQRRRVSLTAVKPSSEKPLPPRAGKPESVRRKSPQRRDEQQGAVRSQQRRDRSGAREGRQRPQPKPRQRPPKAPKPMPPITKEMEEGTEPMRSFSDLLQFYEKKKGSDEESRQS
jgi:uncharacterized protein